MGFANLGRRRKDWMMDPNWLQAARGRFDLVQHLYSGAVRLAGHRTHVATTCSELPGLLLHAAAFLPRGAGSIPAMGNGNQVRVRYRHQDPEFNRIGPQKDTYRNEVPKG